MGRGDSCGVGLPLRGENVAFSDVRFQTAEEKQKVYKAWIRFLDSNLAEAKFSKAIYDHLNQHCGFIAHFNRGGFYQVQFGDPQARARFIENFLSSNMLESHKAGGPDYQDINSALASALQERKEELLYDATQNRVQELEAQKAHIESELRRLKQS